MLRISPVKGEIIMKIAIGCDHVGFEYKMKVIEHLKEKGIEVVDFGTNSTDEINEPTIKVLPYFHQGAKRKQMLPQPCLSFPTVFSGINLLSVIVVGFILT